MDDEDFRLPLESRWSHAKWQIRQSAYKDALEQAEKGILDGFPTMPSNLRDAATDANVVALDTGIRLVTVYLSKCDAQDAERIRSTVCQPLSEKGLGAVKPSVKTAAAEAVMAFVANADAEATVNDLVELMKKKLPPKMMVQLLNSLTQVFTEFGSPVVNPKPVIQSLPAVFSHTDKNVRTAAASLTVALSRWVKPAALAAALGELKPAVLKDLERQWQSAGPPNPTRTTREQSAQANKVEEDLDDANVTPDEEGAENEDGAGDDDWDLTPETEVLSRIPPSFDADVSSVKWKERKEALDTVVPLLNKPRLAAGDYSMLVSVFERVLSKDTNQMCAGLAVQGVQSLASGLRQDFRKYVPHLVQPLVERFKEKKPTFVESIKNCLDTLLRWSSLDLIVDPVLAGTSHRIPAIKLEAALYLAHLICITMDTFPRGIVVNIGNVGAKLLGDPQEPIRKAGAAVLGGLLKKCGPLAIKDILAKLDDGRRARVDESAAQAVVKVTDNNQTAKHVPNKAPAPKAAKPPSIRPPQPPANSTRTKPPVFKEPTKPPPRMSAPQPPSSDHDRLVQSPLRPGTMKSELSSPRAIGSPAPRYSSTPKMGPNKRTLQSAEFTPARQPPPTGRRRLVSPARPHDRLRSDTMPPPSSAPVIPQDILERLKTAEAKVSEQQREISDLKLQLMISRDELTALRQRPIADAEQMSQKLTKMSLQRKSTGPRQQIVPITRHEEPDTSSNHTSDDWQRVIAQTNELKQRVLKLRTERERARVN